MIGIGRESFSPAAVRVLAGVARIALLGAPCATWLACGDDSGEGEGFELTVATYNTGLARSFVDYAVERTPAVGEALAAQSFDVLCLQEVWEQEDWDALVDASGLPHAQRLDPAPDDGEEVVTCTDEEIEPLETCVRAMCDVPPGELTSCSLAMCGDEVNAVSAGCLGCITGVIGEADIDAIVDACGPGGDGGGSSYAYGGSFGLGFLSALPLAGEDSLVLDSTTNRRAVLHAEVDGGDGEPIHLFCTHLSSDLGDVVPYTGAAGGWAEENMAQVQALIDYVDEVAGDERAIVMGDLNTGPALDGIEAELGDSYELLADAFDNPYLEQGDPECTFCPDNALQGVDAGDAVLIDHALLSGWGEVTTRAMRILDEGVTIEVEGDDVDTALSDHYGLELELTY